jgi:hypothetical protein
MLDVLRAGLRRRRGRLAVTGAVALLGATVAMAHTGVGDDHMGEAAAMCLAVVVAGAAVAALPKLRDRAPVQRAAVRLPRPSGPLHLRFSTPHLPRGDPAVLQVFRR